MPLSPLSQASSQRSTSTPRDPGTFNEWQARQRQDLTIPDQSLSGVFSPIRGDLSAPAGTMYIWNRSQLEPHFETTTSASQGTTRATLGSYVNMTGPSVINETELTDAPSLRRTVTFENVSQVMMEDCESEPEVEPPVQRPDK